MQQNTSAMTTIAILRELFAKYGLPVHCVIDNSPQFRSEELMHFMKVNGVKDKIFKMKFFKCDSINVCTIGKLTRCCE